MCETTWVWVTGPEKSASTASARSTAAASIEPAGAPGRPVSASAANQPRSSCPMPSRVPRSVSSTTVSSGASAAPRVTTGCRAPGRSRRRCSRRRSIRSSYHQRPPRRANAAATASSARTATTTSSHAGPAVANQTASAAHSTTTSCPTTTGRGVPGGACRPG
ncbi:hypothetical protein [Micromonospora sp. b486]|uniref:hypothetical protein n=1 Tax=Micromonospora sp. b486 TaxID=3053986 RepID=UPI00259CAD18|nr:hypothetical protein [Micromonospora sp. b486]MDM4784675.1 hypothetical protein [Micromonospora sp. b486]